MILAEKISGLIRAHQHLLTQYEKEFLITIIPLRPSRLTPQYQPYKITVIYTVVVFSIRPSFFFFFLNENLILSKYCDII